MLIDVFKNIHLICYRIFTLLNITDGIVSFERIAMKANVPTSGKRSGKVCGMAFRSALRHYSPLGCVDDRLCHLR